jgi:hypothetical protein
MNQTLCKDCGNPLKGRADRKFCSDACRSNFNNRRYAREKGSFRQVERILHKNRNLLQETWEVKKEHPFRISELASKGFNPRFFTSMESNQYELNYRVCYDIGFHLNEEEGIMRLTKLTVNA